MNKPIDFEQRREALAHKRKDARAADLKTALKLARESGGVEGADQTTATRKLLDLYRKGRPRKP